jgi:uncharacterized membrane protein
MLILLLVSGWMASLFAGFTLVRAWDRALARLPLFRVTELAKQLGESFSRPEGAASSIRWCSCRAARWSLGDRLPDRAASPPLPAS